MQLALTPRPNKENTCDCLVIPGKEETGGGGLEGWGCQEDG